MNPSHSENSGFTRTKCACSQCTACCKRQPAALANGDFERIADYLCEKTQGCLPEDALEAAKKHFWASGGALVKDLSTGQTRRVGTITPKRIRGRCVFLTADDKCSIHEVAPFGCAYFDTHMPYEQAHPRSVWLVGSTSEPEYQALRDTLPYAQSYKPNAY